MINLASELLRTDECKMVVTTTTQEGSVITLYKGDTAEEIKELMIHSNIEFDSERVLELMKKHDNNWEAFSEELILTHDGFSTVILSKKED